MIFEENSSQQDLFTFGNTDRKYITIEFGSFIQICSNAVKIDLMQAH